MVEDEERAWGHIIEEARGRGEEGDIELDLIKLLPAVRKKGLLGRDDSYRINEPGGALRHRVEEADALHLVAKELDPGRQLARRGIDVQDAAAATEAPRHLHQALPLIAHVPPAGEELVDIHPHPFGDDVGQGAEVGGGKGLPRQCARGGDDQRRPIACALHQEGECLQALLNGGRV